MTDDDVMDDDAEYHADVHRLVLALEARLRERERLQRLIAAIDDVIGPEDNDAR